MVAVAAPRVPARRIECIPVLVLGMLQAAGKLPPRREGVAPVREATFEEARVLNWLVQWDARSQSDAGLRRVLGYAAFRDVYDYYTGADVREIVVLQGSPRACVELLRAMQAGAHEQGRRIIGCVNLDNQDLADALDKMGGLVKRVVVEA